MTNPATAAGGHLEDGLLVRLVDDEAEGREEALARAHLAACGECRARLATLRRRDAGLSRLLARTDFPVPASLADASTAKETADVIPLRRRSAPAASHPWLRAAAVVLVALGVGVAASPARAWIAEWLSGRPASAPVAESPQGTGEAGTVVAPVAASSVRFTPAGDELTLAVAHAQSSGALTLVPVAGGEATAEVVAGTGDADLLVLPAGLRIGNEPGAAGDYRVGIPASVRRVRIRVGAGRERVVAREEIGGSLRIALAAER